MPRALLAALALSISMTACDLDDDGGFETGEEGLDSLRDIVDLSVNDASAGVVDDETGGLRLLTGEGAADVGGFNGSGTGNKSIAGLTGYDGTSLGELSLLAMESEAVTGASTPYFNVVVDLDCGCGDLSLIVADSTLATISELGDGTTRMEYLASAPQWKAVGGLGDILPPHLDATGGALSDVLAAYPRACLSDADTGDNGLPRDTVTTAIMVIEGDSVNTSALEQRVAAVEVSARRYTAD